MKNVTLVLTLLIGISCITIAQSVTIGTQVWMTKNLDVITFRNGDTIPQAKTVDEWEKAGENGHPAWCYYNNDPSNGAINGKLYNWYTVNDPRGLAPEGYHVPSNEEWLALCYFLGGEEAAGTPMKSTNGWNEDGNGTNTSGFSGLPGGARGFNRTFTNFGDYGYWWSSHEYGTSSALFLALGYHSGAVFRDVGSKQDGFSVRCLRD